jgi:L-seryl-tRNA(Ser) seleniumtransferase
MNDHAQLNDLLRQLPQVDAVLQDPALSNALAEFRHDVVARVVREQVAALREQLTRGKLAAPPSTTEAAQHAAEHLASLARPLLKPVVNATGVILHTNLGRALLCESAQQAASAAAGAYCNLEYDLVAGERTRRDVTLEPLLRTLTGCEAATVVNNNAAAVYLILHTLAQRREVITSRGELVEIGGSYRVPDVVRVSGCQLVEVGTTNRTRLKDYEQAITDHTALLLKTHTSNYRIIGFTEEASAKELAELSQRRGVPLYVDLGSGYLAPDAGERLDEMDVLETLAAGVGLVSFSGDKLLGGPQAGIILGRRDLILKLRNSPLWRVLRIDKLTVAALGATIVEHMHQRDGRRELPARRHIAHDITQQAASAGALQAQLAAALPGWSITLADGAGYYGGGSLPQEAIPAKVLVVESPSLDSGELHRLLRQGEPSIVGYQAGGKFALNVLTLLPGDHERIVQRFTELARG